MPDIGDEDQITLRFPKGYLNDLEKGVAVVCALQIIRWLKGIRSGMPEGHLIAGKSVDIKTSNNRMEVDFHDPNKNGSDGHRPKRLRLSMSVELKNYQD